MILRDDSSAVVLRNTSRSTMEPSEEWIYRLDQRQKEPRGIFIDGLENPGWAAPSAACYGRSRLYNDNPPAEQGLRLEPESIPFVPGSNRRKIDTQALIAMLGQQSGAIDFKPPRERLEWISGGKTYLVEEYSDSWTVGSVFRLLGREFWLFTEKIACESGVCRPPSRLRLSLLDDATRTSYNFTGKSGLQFPCYFAYDQDAGAIYFAAWEPTGWTVRCISFASAGCSVGPVLLSETQTVSAGAGSASPADTQAIPEAARPYLGRHFYIQQGVEKIECQILQIEPYDDSNVLTEFPSLPPTSGAFIRDRVIVHYRSLQSNSFRGSSPIHLADLQRDLDTDALSKLIMPSPRLSFEEILAMAAQKRCEPSNSIAEAKKRGVLIRILSSDTTDIAYGGDNARLTEIWLESCSIRTPQWNEAGKKVPHYHLCFATNKAASHYLGLFPCFLLAGSHQCFDVTHAGDTAVFFSPPIASPPSFPVSVLSSDFQRNVVFTVPAPRAK